MYLERNLSYVFKNQIIAFSTQHRQDRPLELPRLPTEALPDRFLAWVWVAFGPGLPRKAPEQPRLSKEPLIAGQDRLQRHEVQPKMS